MRHDQPEYARVPGIRVYGMMCNNGNDVTNHGDGGRAKRSNGNASLNPNNSSYYSPLKPDIT